MQEAKRIEDETTQCAEGLHTPYKQYKLGLKGTNKRKPGASGMHIRLAHLPPTTGGLKFSAGEWSSGCNMRPHQTFSKHSSNSFCVWRASGDGLGFQIPGQIDGLQ